MCHLVRMTATNDSHVTPSVGDLVDLHAGLAAGHAARAVNALKALEETGPDASRSVLNQRIGVNLKVAGIHATLALAIAKSGGKS
jgi:hypothetical protein